MTTSIAAVTGVAAGVPYLAVPPVGDRADAPTVIGWHLMDAPRTEAAFAAALRWRDSTRGACTWGCRCAASGPRPGAPRS